LEVQIKVKHLENMANGQKMSSRILKFLISLGYIVCILFKRALLRLLGRTPSASCIVLYYHSIAPEQRNAFAQQMDVVLRLTRPIDGEHVPSLEAGERYSVTTFDDGFEDVIENAVPELVNRGIHAIVFVTVDGLGKTAYWWPINTPERSRRIATAEQIQQMPREWISCGAHTLTHPRLSTVDEARAKHEICESRRQLESLLGYTIGSFSFPFGDYDENVVRWCREAGYERAFTTQHKKAFEDPQAFLVGRVKVEPTDWRLEFRLKLLGGYVWLPWAIALKRRLLRRSNETSARQLGSQQSNNQAA
jgi:peptidoglycan/xylan/chitin deacetylase (PgdA/CDA1 family)